MSNPSDLKYSTSHEWVRLDGDIAGFPHLSDSFSLPRTFHNQSNAAGSCAVLNAQ